MKRIIAAAIFLLIVTIIAVKLIPTDRNRIRKVIAESKSAVREEDIQGVMRGVSYNYHDHFGGSYAQIKQRLKLLFNRYDDFDVSVDTMGVHIKENSAAADLKVSVRASMENNREYLIGDALSAQDMKVYLEKTPSLKWEIIRVDWGEH